MDPSSAELVRYLRSKIPTLLWIVTDEPDEFNFSAGPARPAPKTPLASRSVLAATLDATGQSRATLSPR